MARSEPEAEERELEPNDTEEEPSSRERLALWLRNAQFTVYTALVLLLLALGFLWPRVFISVPPGSSAVMYRFFDGGTVTDRVWGEGLNIIPPWDKLTTYETRMQERQLKFDVLSEEGLDLGVELSIRYRATKEMLGYLHQDIGPEYFDRLIRPEVKAHVRRTFGSRPAHEIYSSARDVLQELGKISTLGRQQDDSTATPYVHILELKLVDLELPDIVESAIADKYKQEQLMLEYRYRLEREAKEAERKRTEAAGIRDYNLIASKVSPDLLRWRSIDATLELAKSQNAKVVVLGGGQGAQMLLNVDGAMGAPLAAQPAQDAVEKGKPEEKALPPPPAAAPVPAAVPAPAPAASAQP
jgi:regulator of protease activity HflC (stomatin/prohibitin superfamily)